MKTFYLKLSLIKDNINLKNNLKRLIAYRFLMKGNEIVNKNEREDGIELM